MREKFAKLYIIIIYNIGIHIITKDVEVIFEVRATFNDHFVLLYVKKKKQLNQHLF